jgi:hypothetical protein
MPVEPISPELALIDLTLAGRDIKEAWPMIDPLDLRNSPARGVSSTGAEAGGEQPSVEALLFNAGVISADQLGDLVRDAVLTQRPVAAVALERGLATPDLLETLLARAGVDIPRPETPTATTPSSRINSPLTEATVSAEDLGSALSPVVTAATAPQSPTAPLIEALQLPPPPPPVALREPDTQPVDVEVQPSPASPVISGDAPQATAEQVATPMPLPEPVALDQQPVEPPVQPAAEWTQPPDPQMMAPPSAPPTAPAPSIHLLVRAAVDEAARSAPMGSPAAPLPSQPQTATAPTPAGATVEPRFAVLVRLNSGEQLSVEAAATFESATQLARSIAGRFSRAGEWPLIGGRCIRPEAVVSVDIERALES